MDELPLREGQRPRPEPAPWANLCDLLPQSVFSSVEEGPVSVTSESNRGQPGNARRTNMRKLFSTPRAVGPTQVRASRHRRGPSAHEAERGETGLAVRELRRRKHCPPMTLPQQSWLTSSRWNPVLRRSPETLHSGVQGIDRQQLAEFAALGRSARRNDADDEIVSLSPPLPWDASNLWRFGCRGAGELVRWTRTPAQISQACPPPASDVRTSRVNRAHLFEPEGSGSAVFPGSS